MENSVGFRIKQIRTHYNLSVKEFAGKCGLSHVAIFHLENGKTLKPHKSSILRIATAFASSCDWLLYEKDEMFPNGPKDMTNDYSEQEAYWKQEAYDELKTRNLKLELEIERLWQIINHFTGNVNSKFERVLEAG